MARSKKFTMDIKLTFTVTDPSEDDRAEDIDLSVVEEDLELVIEEYLPLAVEITGFEASGITVTFPVGHE